MTDLTVKVLKESDKFTDSLGISEERAQAIGNAFMHAYIDHIQFSDMAEEVSKICTHPNELLFLGTCLGKRMMMQTLHEEGVHLVKANKSDRED